MGTTAPSSGGLAHTGLVERARSSGGRIGLAVAATFVPVAFALPVPTPDPMSTLLLAAIPTLIAGWLGGRLTGPWALRAATRWNWFVIVLRLALLAVLIGAPIVAFELAVSTVIVELSEGLITPLWALLRIVGNTVLLTALGTTFVGPAIGLATIPAAAIWAFAMSRRLRTGGAW